MCAGFTPNAYDAEKRRICLGPAAPGEPPACEVRSNLAKVSATSPSGSVADIPDGLGDGIKWANGFECVAASSRVTTRGGTGEVQ